MSTRSCVAASLSAVGRSSSAGKGPPCRAGRSHTDIARRSGSPGSQRARGALGHTRVLVSFMVRPIRVRMSWCLLEGLHGAAKRRQRITKSSAVVDNAPCRIGEYGRVVSQAFETDAYRCWLSTATTPRPAACLGCRCSVGSVCHAGCRSSFDGGLQPHLHQMEHPSRRIPVATERISAAVRDGIEVLRQIGIHHLNVPGSVPDGRRTASWGAATRTISVSFVWPGNPP